MAVSISPMSLAPVGVSANAVAPTAEPSETVETVMISPSIAPTWNVIWPALLSSWTPLNWTCAPIRLISSCSWLTSDWIAVRSSVDSVPFLYWTASSRTRCSIEWTSFSAPSAVCTSDTASCGLRMAWEMPLI